jgi:TRAP-type C4-dicarboxylate transport system substrate-binding protein
MRALPAVVTAALVALLAGCGGSGGDRDGAQAVATPPATYEDAVGDGGSGPDIRSVRVSSSPDGRISFRVTIAGLDGGSSTAVDLWLDADADPETGNTTFQGAGGAEYLFGGFVGLDPPDDPFCARIHTGNGCFARYTPNGWRAKAAPTAQVERTARSVTFSIDRSDLGDPDELNFFLYRGGSSDWIDERAPGTGAFSYSFALGGPAPERGGAAARADKAGGQHGRRAAVLRLASHDYLQGGELADVAATIERLSGGSLRVELLEGYRYYEADYERGMIADVRSGAVDAALVGARAWDRVGVTSFQALVAPFLVDSFELEERVLESPQAERMLEGVEPLGLVGVALLPGELRRPLGLSRALVRPEDYAGATIGMRPAGIATATFAALGARATAFQATPAGVAGLDGIESGLGTIQNSRYDRDARALTANVVLWPRPTTVVVNAKAFEALDSQQQQALRALGAELTGPMLETLRGSHQASLAAICRAGRLELVSASPADAAALREAVQPVYARLERDPLTRELVAEIESLRRGVATAADEPLRCPDTRPATARSPLDGRWRTEVSRAELLAAGAQREDADRFQGTTTLELGAGRWSGRVERAGGVFRGTYEVDGDVLRLTFGSCEPTNLCTAGHVDEYRWSVFVYRNTLTLAPIPGRTYAVLLVAKPLSRIS